MGGCILAAAFLASATPAAADVLIDDFTSGSHQAPPTPSEIAAGGVPGGVRYIASNTTSGPSRIFVDALFGQSLTYNTRTVQTSGSAEFGYDGVDDDAFVPSTASLNLDLDPMALSTFDFDVSSNGVSGLTLQVQIWTNGAMSSSPVLSVPDGFSGRFFVPFTLFVGAASFSDVDAILVLLSSPPQAAANQTFVLDTLSASSIPEPTSFALLGVVGLVGGGAGYLRRRKAKAVAAA
jgi:hypothetical protein